MTPPCSLVLIVLVCALLRLYLKHVDTLPSEFEARAGRVGQCDHVEVWVLLHLRLLGQCPTHFLRFQNLELTKLLTTTEV